MSIRQLNQVIQKSIHHLLRFICTSESFHQSRIGQVRFSYGNFSSNQQLTLISVRFCGLAYEFNDSCIDIYFTRVSEQSQFIQKSINYPL